MDEAEAGTENSADEHSPDDPILDPICVLRGRAADADEDRAATRTLAADVRDTRQCGVRAWTPRRQVVFGPRDARADGYDRARETAREHGFPPQERDVGGRAVAYTGSTVAFVRCEPLGDVREGLRTRYDAATAAVERALSDLGVVVERGEPPDAFCPGSHSLSTVDGGKLVGLAQRVQRGVAQTAGVVVVRDRRAIADVLGDVYAALDLPFDPDSVGSVASAGGPDAPEDPALVARAVEDALVGDRARVVETMAEA